MQASEHTASERVLVLMTSPAETRATTQWLEDAELEGTTCADLAALRLELQSGAGALLVSDAVVRADEQDLLGEILQDQPEWSDLPVIIHAAADPCQLLPLSGSVVLRNTLVIEGPPRSSTLLSALAAALRARRQQYQCHGVALALQLAEAKLAQHAEEVRHHERLKDDFLATLAHELRNPLAPIRTGIDLLATASPPPDVAKHTLGVMQRQLGHMVRLIDDLLDVSRITQGKLELKRERVTLTTIVDLALEASRPFVAQGRHSLQVDVTDQALWFDADLTRIAQVISNLIHNASKYTAPNGEISLHARREQDQAVIEVADNGVGIPPDRLEDVFAMFSQVNRVLDRSQGGLGIGLSLVRRLVEMHGGTVSANSAGPSRGSTFTVRLPLAGDARMPLQAATSQAHEEDVSAETKRILVVDDNDDAADLLSLMLEHAGHLTTTAHDGPSALAAVQAWSPHIVFLDIGLPGMNGYDVARQLRLDPRFSDMGLIALTGWGTREDKRKADAAGFDVHLTKPIDARALHGVLEQLAARGR